MGRTESSRRGGVEAWRVNSFTFVPFTGNPAGVVPEAGGLTDGQMQAIARELNDISETVFVCPPDLPGAQFRLRYFTSACEVDLCGHATVAALFTLAWTGRLAGRDGVRTLRAATRVGLLELELTFGRGEPEWAAMEQLEPRLNDSKVKTGGERGIAGESVV